MSALDYSRFDGIDSDSDEDKNQPRDPGDVLGEPLDEAREALRKRVEELVKTENKKEIAYFVAVQRREPGAACNHDRHVEIIKLLSTWPSLRSEATSEALCKLASNRFEEKDNTVAIFIVEAINTLEAARRYDGALAFFKAICPPQSDRARAMRDEYAKQTFGQLRLKRFVYKKLLSQDPDFETVLTQHEHQALAAIDPPPPVTTPPRRSSSSGGGAWWFFLFPVVVVAVFGYYAYYISQHGGLLDSAQLNLLKFLENNNNNDSPGSESL